MSQTSIKTRASFGAGGAPIGVIQNGIAFFLLIYYNQVLGLDAGLAALALSIALIFDAVTDPLIGFWSDNCKSRLGRRHPFMYAAAVPAGLSYYLIWHPGTELTDASLFLYLLATAVALRTSVTLFDVPHNALIAELSDDYHERTTLSTFKVAMIQFFGYVMVLAMYGVWLVPSEEYAYGILNKDGYQTAGMVSAILITTLMLAATAGLHDKIARLREFAHEATVSVSAFFHQTSEALKIGSFKAIIVSGIATYIGGGFFYALWAYVMNYYWGLDTDQTFYVLLANFLGAMLGSVTATSYLRRGDKKRNAIMLSLVAIAINAFPYVFRMLGFFPENGTDALLTVLLVHGVFQVWISVWIYSVSWSMTADISEQNLVSGGYQNEGIILAATTFTAKAGIAGGMFFAGMVLEWINFPEQAGYEPIEQSIIDNLGIAFVTISAALSLTAVWALTKYRIHKESHEEAVRSAAGLRG